MPEVMVGEQPGLTVAELQQRMADQFGKPSTSQRYGNMVLRWANDIIRDVQAHDPAKRRTIVYDAEFSLVAGQTQYDVRDSVNDGGFGWTNCFEVLDLRIPSLESRSLEALGLSQFRARSYAAEVGPPGSWVALDQFRVVISPSPESDYDGLGDYRQNIPALSAAEHKVDWPRAWDAALLEGVTWKALFQDEPSAVSAWETQRRIYEERRDDIRLHDMKSPATMKPVMLRTRGRVIPHDNSADVR